MIKGALLCSGKYNLKPVRLSARSNYVRFTARSRGRAQHPAPPPRISCPVVLAYGTKETPEFQRQTRDFAAALDKAGKPMQRLVADGYNHLRDHRDDGEPLGLIGRAALAQMKLADA